MEIRLNLLAHSNNGYPVGTIFDFQNGTPFLGSCLDVIRFTGRGFSIAFAKVNISFRQKMFDIKGIQRLVIEHPMYFPRIVNGF